MRSVGRVQLCKMALGPKQAEDCDGNASQIVRVCGKEAGVTVRLAKWKLFVK